MWFTVLSHIFGDDKGIKFFKNTHHLRLYTLNGSVNISTLNVEFWLIVSFLILSVSKELHVILFVKGLTKKIMHFLAICSQLSIRVFTISIDGRIVIFFWVNRITGSMSEKLIDHNESWGLRINHYQQEESNAQFVFEHFIFTLCFTNLYYWSKIYKNLNIFLFNFTQLQQ